MKRMNYSKFALLLTCILLLAGCGGSSSKATDSIATNTTEAAGATGWADDAMTEEAKSEYGDPQEAEAVTEESTSESFENDLNNRKLIKTVYLDMQTEDFDSLKDNLEETIESNGGYIESSYLNTPKSDDLYRSYELTIRIPADKMDLFIETIGSLGYITSKNETIEDVTLTYVDMTAYKEAMETEYKKVLELLENATELDQILVLESKLSELRYEINSYESRLRTYDNLIDYSTIHIYVNEVKYAIETKDTIGSRISSGFLSSLYSVRDFFVELFVAFVSNLPVLIVLAVFIGIMILIFRKIVKSAAQKKERRCAANTHMYNRPDSSTLHTETPSERAKETDSSDHTK